MVFLSRRPMLSRSTNASARRWLAGRSSSLYVHRASCCTDHVVRDGGGIIASSLRALPKARLAFSSLTNCSNTGDCGMGAWLVKIRVTNSVL